MTTTIKWLIAHEPVELFLRTANAFSKKIAELTDNKYTVEIFTAAEANEHLFKGNPKDPMTALDNGEIQMSQLHISELARWHSPDFFALDLPFLFKDHDHASRVLEGEIGQTMLKGLSSRSPATGMSFTYSGGYRCVVSEKPIDSIGAFKHVNFATNYNPVSIDTVEAFGAVAKPFAIADYHIKTKAEGSGADVLETTIPRYLAQFKDTNKKFMTNTKHSLFLTSIIIGNNFWQTLDQETKVKFQQACDYAAQLERKWSVEEAEQFAEKLDHSDIGVSYRELTEKEMAELKTLTAPVVDKYKNFFTAGLIDGIIKS
jgi:TRAP-type C4-dicarboxylate transport system substrate-binding protein